MCPARTWKHVKILVVPTEKLVLGLYTPTHTLCIHSYTYASPAFQDKDLEMCAQNLKLEQLDAELQDLSSQETKDEASLSKVKKQLRDLEAKVKDQEEELDEQAGTIQMLEQVHVVEINQKPHKGPRSHPPT